MRLNKEFVKILKESGVDRHYNQNHKFVLSFLDLNIIEEKKKDKRNKKFIEYYENVKKYLKKNGIKITKKSQLFDLSDNKIEDKKLKINNIEMKKEKKGLYLTDDLEEIKYYIFPEDGNIYLNVNIKCLKFFDLIMRNYGKSDIINLGKFEVWTKYYDKTKEKYIEREIKKWYIEVYLPLKENLM